MAMMQKKRTYECCGISYSGMTTLREHITACHKKGFKCKICDRVFAKPSILRRHNFVHFDSNVQFTRTRCDFTTKNEYSLKKHARLNKCKKTNSIFECCDIRFVNTMEIRQHTSIFHPDGLKCSTCERVFKIPSQLRLHKLVHFDSKSIAVRNADLKEDESESSNRKKNSSISPNKINRKYVIDSASDGVRGELPFSQSVGVQLHSRLTTEEVLSSSNDSSNKLLPLSDKQINSIHEEARLVRTQTLLAITVATLIPLLKRLLTLSAFIMNRIRETKEINTCSQIIETFEYVWNTCKMVIIRWEDLKGCMSQDASLTLIQNSYGTLPVFINWENSKHLLIFENAILLGINTVSNWQPPLISQLETQVKLEPIAASSTNIHRSSPCSMPRIKSTESESRNEELEKKLVASVAVRKVSIAKDVVSVPSKKMREIYIREVMEFCRLTNISIWQNTKERNMNGYRDDSGDYHAIYRYGMRKIINLYCPPGVTHLKCCKKVFNLSRLKTHVTRYHEAGNANRTEPSISPP